jgi:hypothetical protein
MGSETSATPAVSPGTKNNHQAQDDQDTRPEQRTPVVWQIVYDSGQQEEGSYRDQDNPGAAVLPVRYKHNPKEYEQCLPGEQKISEPPGHQIGHVSDQKQA